MDAVLSSHYFRVGLGYAFGVNIAGLWLMYRALRSDLFFFRGSVQVPRWFLVACGLLFQAPGILYFSLGIWAGRQAP